MARIALLFISVGAQYSPDLHTSWSNQIENLDTDSRDFPPPKPEPAPSIFDLAKSVPAAICSESSCCTDLVRSKAWYKILLKDASGTPRQPGIQLGLTATPPSDGRVTACQKMANDYTDDYGNTFYGGKYCMNNRQTARFNLNLWVPNVWECLPNACDAKSLNEIIEVVNASRIHYDYCLADEVKFSWYEIVGWTVLAIWAVFLFFSPIKQMRIQSSLSFLGNFRQSPAALKSINGIRVLSIIWVCMGHTFLALISAYSNNTKEVIVHFSRDYPNMILLLNGTVSVDTFFAIGGLVASYVLTRKIIRSEYKFNWSRNFLESGLNRFLRLVPNLLALAFVGVCLVNHEQGLGDEPLYPKWNSEVQGTNFLGYGCTGYNWAAVTFLMMNWLYPYLDISNGFFCNGWTWYLSNEYWYYLVCLILVPMILSKSYGTKIAGYASFAALFIILFSVLIALTEYCSFYFNYYLYSNIENYKYYGNNSAPGCGNQETSWNQVYFMPWYRYGPYLVGCLAGKFLAEKNYHKKFEIGLSKLKQYALMAGVILGLIAVIYFPMPIAFKPVYYPQWVADLYEGFHRTLWGVLICALVILIEGGVTGPWDVLKSDYFLVFSKLSLSAYLIHYYSLSWTIQIMFDQSYHLSPNLGVFVSVASCFTMYITGIVFFVLFEAPFAVLSQILMAKLFPKK